MNHYSLIVIPAPVETAVEILDEANVQESIP